MGVAQAPSLQLQSLTTTRLVAPTFVTNANDGQGRMFILEQAGRILVVPPHSATASVFLDLTPKVLTSTERGLVGLAFHPDFSENRRFFVNYTRKTDGTIVVAEYHASAANANLADNSGDDNPYHSPP
jgi:glucose/arabinose dehydrogenase